MSRMILGTEASCVSTTPFIKLACTLLSITIFSGWNDVGWHNPDIKTPNLDRMARGGVIFNSSYMQPLCSP